MNNALSPPTPCALRLTAVNLRYTLSALPARRSSLAQGGATCAPKPRKAGRRRMLYAV
jgi:hypothetical protein